MTKYISRYISGSTEKPYGVYAITPRGEYLDGLFTSRDEAQAEATRRSRRSESEQPKTRTITLTDRAPVSIREDLWPIIASAKRWDNQHECQANRTWRLTVRQHEDGRAIVYAAYDSQYQGERGQRAGELLAADADLPAAIRRVGETGGCDQCIDDCIADLPAVEI